MSIALETLDMDIYFIYELIMFNSIPCIMQWMEKLYIYIYNCLVIQQYNVSTTIIFSVYTMQG